MSDLTTIVVNWNTVDLLDDCLRSILDATPAGLDHDVIVVDNASRDGSVAHLRRAWPQVRLIENDENLGFCRANNLAIAASESPLLLLVNTDARLQPGGIATLLEYFERDPRIGVVGPRLAYADGSFQRWTGGRLPSLSSMSTFLLGLDRWRPLNRAGHYLGRDLPQPVRTQWVSSAVMAIRRSAVDEVGPLDPSIFVYMDDVDLCQRMGVAGWHVWYAADTTATHFMGASSVRNTGKVSPEALRALNRWYVGRHGRLSGYALRAVELVGFGGRFLLHTAAGVAGSAPARDRQTVHLTHLRLALEAIDA